MLWFVTVSPDDGLMIEDVVFTFYLWAVNETTHGYDIHNVILISKILYRETADVPFSVTNFRAGEM